MTNKQRTKRQHIIPRLYLEGFTDEQGMIWAYAKNNPNKPPHCQKPEKTAVYKEFYTARIDGKKSSIFEDAMAEIIESPAATALSSLIQCTLPTFDDRQRLSLLFGFMLARTPAFRENYEKQLEREINQRQKIIASSNEQFQKSAKEYEAVFKQPLADDLEKLRQEILNGQYKMKLHENYSLQIMQNMGFNISYALPSMKWTKIKAPDSSYFLTSDNPIFITNPSINGFISPGLGIINTIVLLPISKSVSLLMVLTESENFSTEIITCDEKTVNKINLAIIDAASKFVYSSHKDSSLDQIVRALSSSN